MRGLRRSIQSLVASVGAEKGVEERRAGEVQSASSEAARDLEALVSALSKLGRAQADAFEALSAMYPPRGPLSDTLVALTTDSASPFAPTPLAARLENLRTIAGPVEGLSSISQSIATAAAERDRLKREVDHYSAKVGRLADELTRVKPSDREAAAKRLEDNRGKLRAAMDQHAALLHQVDKDSASLEPDLIAVLGPTIVQLVKQLAGFYSDAGAWLGGVIEGGADAIAAARAAAVVAPPPAAAVSTRGKPMAVAPVGPARGAMPSATGEASAPTAAAAAAAAAAAPHTHPLRGVSGPTAAAVTAMNVSRLGPVNVPAAVAETSTSSGAQQHGLPSAAAPRTQAAAAAPPPPAPAQPHSPILVRAECDYAGEEESDLQVRAGELYVVTEAPPSGWWQARQGEEYGLIPSNHVAAVSDVSKLPVICRAEAVHAYTPEETSELAVAAGQAVDLLEAATPATGPEGTRVAASGWVLARAGAKWGYLPLSYLKVKPSGSGAAATAVAAGAPASARAAGAGASAASAPSAARSPAPSSAPAPVPAVTRVTAAPASGNGGNGKAKWGGGGGGGGAPTAAAGGPPRPALPASLLAGVRSFDKHSLSQTESAESAPPVRASAGPGAGGGGGSRPASSGGGPSGGSRPMSMMEEMRARQQRGTR